MFRKLFSRGTHLKYRPDSRLCLSIALLLTTACSSLPARERSFDTALCNKSASYEAGFNDGEEGRPMASNFLYGCRTDLRAEAQEGYRTGYDTGRQHFDQRMKE